MFSRGCCDSISFHLVSDDLYTWKAWKLSCLCFACLLVVLIFMGSCEYDKSYQRKFNIFYLLWYSMCLMVLARVDFLCCSHFTVKLLFCLISIGHVSYVVNFMSLYAMYGHSQDSRCCFMWWAYHLRSFLWLVLCAKYSKGFCCDIMVML